MTNLKWLVYISLATVTLSTTHAAPHCPGNVASLRLRLVQRSEIIVPVEINHTGPYDFMVDTGAQVTTVDPALASELGLKILGTTGVTGVGHSDRAAYVRLDSIQAGTQSVEHVLAVVQSLGQVQAADRRVRGVLAANFMEHFDVLIDYAHSMLCLDGERQMQSEIKGEHIPLVRQTSAEGDMAFTEPPVIPVHIYSVESQLLLRLDSGSNAPLLYEAARYLKQIDGPSLHTKGTDGTDHAFMVLAAQDVQVGNRAVHQIPFVTPVSTGREVPKVAGDGLLPTVLFQRVYISYADHFAVLDPW